MDISHTSTGIESLSKEHKKHTTTHVAGYHFKSNTQVCTKKQILRELYHDVTHTIFIYFNGLLRLFKHPSKDIILYLLPINIRLLGWKNLLFWRKWMITELIPEFFVSCEGDVIQQWYSNNYKRCYSYRCTYSDNTLLKNSLN